MRGLRDSVKLKNLQSRVVVIAAATAMYCNDVGEVAERFKAHAWKACVG